MEALHDIFFKDTNLRCIIINVKSEYPHLKSLSFSRLPPPLLHSSFYLASYYLLLFVVWSPSRWPAFLALWFCSGDFISLLIVPAD